MLIQNETQGYFFGPEPKDGPKWGQQRRLEFIDYRLTWDGIINRKDLVEFFGISVPQASLDISEYLKRAAMNLAYDPKTKIYRAQPQFKSIYPSSSLPNFLDDLLRVAVCKETPYGSFLGWTPSVDSVPRPSRRLDSKIVLVITRALRSKSKVNILYQSFSDTDPIRRLITPHTLVHDGYRWHARAYCHLRNEFKDFVISRIFEAEFGEQDISRIQDDVQWNRIVDLELTAHPHLTPSQKKIIEMDYGMSEGVLRMQSRQALLFYVFKQLGLDRSFTNIDPVLQQIVLKNIDQISDYLPKYPVR